MFSENIAINHTKLSLLKPRKRSVIDSERIKYINQFVILNYKMAHQTKCICIFLVCDGLYQTRPNCGYTLIKHRDANTLIKLFFINLEKYEDSNENMIKPVK